jgi:integrase
MGLFRRGKIFWFTIMANGRRIQRSTGTENKRLAENIFAKVKTQLVEGKWFEIGEAKLHTFDEMMEKYLREHSAINKAPTSHENDKCYVRHLSKVFSGLTLDKITPKLINEYKNRRITKGISLSTLKKELICLSHALKFAMKEWEWISMNPMQRVKIPNTNNQIDRWLTYEEQDRLLQACYDRQWLRDITIFAVNTGMRQGEIRNLSWQDVDLFRKTATIHKTKNKEKRTIPLNQTVIDLLKAKSKIVSLKGYVFAQYDDKSTKREIQKQFSTAIKRAKIDNFRFHDLRHTFATRLAQAGVDIYTIAKLMGHKDIRMTQRYAHHCPESLRSGVNILDNLNSQKAVYYNSATVNENKPFN